MKNEIKKIAKIVDEILTYFMHHYRSDATVAVRREGGAYIMRFEFAPVTIEDEEIARLEKRLSARRRPELEDYYWQLAGEVEDNNEIRLVAMMCDTGALRREGEKLVLELTRRVD